MALLVQIFILKLVIVTLTCISHSGAQQLEGSGNNASELSEETIQQLSNFTGVFL